MNNESKKQQMAIVPEGVEKQRLSKAYLLVGLIKAIKSAIIPIVIILAGSMFGGGGVNEVLFHFPPFPAITRIHFFALILLIGLLVALISVGIQYLCTYWFLSTREVVLCKGLLNKKITRMPFEKIHSINTSESLIERICNVVSVKIDSAGGAASGDIIIPAIKNETAENLRIELKQRMQFHSSDASATTSPPPLNADDTESNATFSQGNNSFAGADTARGYAVSDARQYNLTILEILLAGLANGRTILYLFIGIGAGWQLIDSIGFSDYFYEHGSEIARRFVNLGVSAIALAVISLLFVSWIVSVASFAVKFYGFTIRTEGDRIETRRGLISRINTQISINRIQEIHVSQNVLAKLFRYATIKAEIATNIVAKDGNDQNGMGTTGVILHPFIKKKDVDGYIAAFIPEYVNRPQQFEPLPKAACRRSFFRYARWTLIFWVLPIAACLILIPSYAFSLMPLIKNIAIIVGIIGVIFSMFTAWRSYKGKGFTIGEKIVAVKYGAYKTKLAYVPKRKIQMAHSKQNPFQRAAKVSHVTIYTAASGFKTHLLDVSVYRAEEYLNWATPESIIRKPVYNKEGQ